MTEPITRRDFLKIMGAAGAATAGVAACTNAGKGGEAEPEKGKMTYRTNPTTGDKVSLLGYGMMRLPSKSGRSAREGEDEEIDQEMVNRLVDYALEHGVNYFDTSPAYCKGMSEHATGIALSRHPRNKYFIATKLSNFAPETWTREASIAMYRNSLKELQTDHIDYMLLHGAGMGEGMEEYESRYIKNGILDFLMEERKAGRIRNLGFSYHGDVKVFDLVLAPRSSDFLTYRALEWVCARLHVSPPESFAVSLVNTGLAEQFMIHIKTAMCVSVLCASPYILYRIFRFISPALYAGEKRYALWIAGSGYVMFMIGVSVSYLVIFPLTFRFLGTYQVTSDVANMITLQSYMSTLIMMCLTLGIVFEMPVIIWLLSRMGLITAGFLRTYRRHAIVAILIVAAIITPTSDVFTLTLVSLPMYLLYELSILLCRKG